MSSAPSISGPALPTGPAPGTVRCSTRSGKASGTSRTSRSRALSRGLFSEVNLGADKLGRTYEERNAKLCAIVTRIADGLAEFSTDSDALGDACEYLIGQFAAGSGKKAGEFYTPQRTSDILSAIVTLDSQAPNSGPRRRLARVLDFACGSGSLLLNVRKRTAPPEEEIDLAETHGELVEIETQLQASATKHNAFLEEPWLAIAAGGGTMMSTRERNHPVAPGCSGESGFCRTSRPRAPGLSAVHPTPCRPGSDP